jgi:hypothetical protein
MVFGFCGVVVLLYVDELGECVRPPRLRLWHGLRLRRCAVVLRSGSVVLCSGPDLCGSGAELRSGSCRGCSQLLRSGSGCCSQLLRSGRCS